MSRQQTDSDDGQRLDLARRLREAREYVGLSQEEVAFALLVSRPAISNIEAGTRKVEERHCINIGKTLLSFI